MCMTILYLKTHLNRLNSIFKKVLQMVQNQISYNHKLDRAMNKTQRLSLKNNLNLSPSYRSPNKKFKQREQSSRRTLLKKSKDHSLPGTSKTQKVKSVSIYQRNEKMRLSENKTKKEKKMMHVFQSPKLPKKTKKVSNNKQNKNHFREIQHPKLIEEYLQSKIISTEKRNHICNESTKFFLPFTHALQKQSSVHYISQLVSSDESYIQKDVPSQFSVPLSNQKMAQRSNLKNSRIISMEQWENYETLKLKNEQLTNYIEQLQKIQKKMIEQKQQQQRMLKDQHKKSRDKLMQQFAELNKKHLQVSNNNAALQQMFNQGQSIIQALKLQNAHLSQRASLSFEQAKQLKNNNEKIKNDSIYLKPQSFTLKEALKSLQMEKEQMSRRQDLVRLQKEKIKTQAQQMLLIIKRMQTQHES